ncbi:sulfatase [Actinopolymorpha singaporensis]
MNQASLRPNIVFVLIDDLGWADLGCYGSTFYETPHLDRLAAAGARFTDAYAAAPVCSPTRASIMSGKYPARVGVTQWIGGHAVGRLRDVPYFRELPMEEYSLARALRDGGYQTWHVGKWHLGERRTWPDRHGFDVNVGGCGLGHPPSYVSPYGIPTLPDGPPGEYLTDRLTDEAIKLVENAGEQPFFLNLWHYAVHTPIQAPEDLVGRYEQKAKTLGLDEIDAIKPGEPMPTWHQRHQHVQRRVVQSDPGYAAMVENLDANIGRLLDALDRTGKADNTLVVFTSDNGGLATSEGSPTCNAPLAEGKGWMYDGGLRVPLIVRWPGTVEPNNVLPDLVTSPDFYPTFLDAAGIPRPAQMHELDGQSILAALTEGQAEDRPIFWHYPHYGNQGGTPGAAIREGDWKLVRFFEDNHIELYNLVDDIAETHDLADTKPGVAARLNAKLGHWLEDVQARIPASNPVSAYADLPG